MHLEYGTLYTQCDTCMHASLSLVQRMYGHAWPRARAWGHGPLQVGQVEAYSKFSNNTRFVKEL